MQIYDIYTLNANIYAYFMQVNTPVNNKPRPFFKKVWEF